MAFNPIIRIKRGNGIPSSLSPGEMAFDIENQILRIGSAITSTDDIAAEIKEIGGEGKFTTLDTPQIITGEKSFERLNLLSNTDNTYLKIDGIDVVPLVLDDVVTEPLTAEDLNILHRTSSVLDKFTGKSELESDDIDAISDIGTLGTVTPNKVVTVDGNRSVQNINDIGVESITLTGNKFTIGGTTDSDDLNFNITGPTNLTLPTSGTLSTTSNKLNVFGATTSAEFAEVISDETGSGALVFANTPTLVTPVLGVASATSINKVAITSPTTSATLTLSDNSTLATSGGHSLTFTTTGTTNVTLPTTGTLLTAAALPVVNDGTLTLGVSGNGLSGSQTFTANQSSAATFTVTSNGTNANTEFTLVYRGKDGNFSAGTITASLTGTATNATNINTENRTTNEEGHLTFIGTTATGNVKPYSNTNIRINPSTQIITLIDPGGGFSDPTSIKYGSRTIVIGDATNNHTLKFSADSTVITGTKYQTTIAVNSSLASNNTVSFPISSGTLALTSQIPSVITQLSGLSDVSFSSLETGNILVYNGTEGWTNSNIIDGGTFS